jgi:hypothetical protein
VIPAKLPTFTVAELEGMAASFLRNAMPQGVQIPVDIDLLLERQGVDLDYWPNLKSIHGVAGAVLRDTNSNSLVIYIDQEIADEDSGKNFYRTTVAEELGHVVLHGTAIQQVVEMHDFRQLQRHSMWHQAERNAKRFGYSLLMPQEELLRESNQIYPKLVLVAGYGDGEAIKMHLCSQLARKFEVSHKTMSIRMTEWPMRINEKVDQAIRSRIETLDF